MIRRLMIASTTAAMLAGCLPACAATLDLPLERQVFQRNAGEWADVTIGGSVPSNATIVEAKAEIAAGLRGAATEWTIVAKDGQIKDGKFSGTLRLATGGWYVLKVRFRKSADDQSVLEEASVPQVGVGDVFITAGQSNSANYGNPRQKSNEPLSVYFDGKKFTPASDPLPASCGGGGTPWPILGDLISRTTRAPVCFRSATVNWLRVREWLPGEKSGNIERLVERTKWFGSNGVRAVLWVQGEADAGRPDFTPAEQYEKEAIAMIAFSREKLGWPIDWFVGATCYCPPHGPQDWKEGMAAVTTAQTALWKKGVAFPGPDTNDLIGSADYRHDGIHFGGKGLLVHAERWYAALCTHYQWANPLTRPRLADNAKTQ